MLKSFCCSEIFNMPIEVNINIEKIKNDLEYNKRRIFNIKDSIYTKTGTIPVTQNDILSKEFCLQKFEEETEYVLNLTQNDLEKYLKQLKKNKSGGLRKNSVSIVHKFSFSKYEMQFKPIWLTIVFRFKVVEQNTVILEVLYQEVKD